MDGKQFTVAIPMTAMRRSRGYELFVGGLILLGYTAVSGVGFILLGWFVSDPPGLFVIGTAFVVGVFVAAYMGYRAGTLRLIASLEGQEIPPRRAPELFRRLDRLCLQMGVTRPPLLVAALDAPNALTVGGPRQGAVVIDWSLLELLTIDELEAILAHELAHLERGDTFVNTLVLTGMRSLAGLVLVFLLPVTILLAGIDRSVGWFVGRPGSTVGFVRAFHWFVLLVLGLLFGVGTLAYLAYSHRQEYAADRRAGEVTGKPVALARALAKLHHANNPRGGLLAVLYTHDRRQEHHPFLSTHPPVDARINRLLAQANQQTNQHHIERLKPR